MMKYLSLFSGIGGFELGLQNSKYDFECIGFSEIDEYAKSIYTRHFLGHKDLGNASEIDPKELQDFELLVGGFPCQAFSLAGNRQGFDDTRGTLFFEVARILKEKKPKYFLLENVHGLLSHDKGRTFKTMLGIFSELGYDVEWQTFNSKDFGTCQHRDRIYIKGYFRAKCGREILSVRRSYPKTGVRKAVGLKLHTFNRQVKKRVHSVDYDELSQFLRSAKKKANISVIKISEKLGKPQTEVEHWFRTDDFFAPPTDDIWFDLKELLGIESDTYDAFLTEFEWVDGVYEIDKRAYGVDGLSPTLTTTETLVTQENDDRSVKKIGNIHPNGHSQSGTVYNADGLSGSLCATDHKNPIKVVTDRKIKRVMNTSATNHMGADVLGVDGLSTSITSSNYKHPLQILETDGMEVEKVYGSTQKHRAETDGTYSPTLTSAMGMGGGHIPMLQLKKSNWKTVNNDFRIRRLTPRECERLQAFPDDWTRYGADGEEISDTQRYKCLGNAVTTTVVTWIADNYLFGADDA